jgi:hypothetical protein
MGRGRRYVRQAAACLNVISLSIAWHNASRPAGPSFALPWICIRVLLGSESWQTHSLGRGPDASPNRSQPMRARQLASSTADDLRSARRRIRELSRTFDPGLAHAVHTLLLRIR